jgi:hypothetical protein
MGPLYVLGGFIIGLHPAIVAGSAIGSSREKRFPTALC